MNPIAINQYAKERHEEIVREAEAYWKAELARAEADAYVPKQNHQPSKPLQDVVRQLITFLH
ncbi:MAG: hypothetical protein K8J31_08170 [Anaerolineae bacterium]|nr:hypothetical protein [Anaerolineae bacterium]